MTDIAKDIQFARIAALRNVFYHNGRQTTLERIYRIVNFLILVSGTATAAGVMQLFNIQPETGALVLGGITTILGGASLVYDFSSRANVHMLQSSKYNALLGEIDGTTNATEQQVAAWKRQLIEIAGGDPPSYRAAQALAQNEAMQAIYGDAAKLLAVNWYIRALANVWPFRGKVFQHVDAPA